MYEYCAKEIYEDFSKRHTELQISFGEALRLGDFSRSEEELDELLYDHRENIKEIDEIYKKRLDRCQVQFYAFMGLAASVLVFALRCW